MTSVGGARLLSIMMIEVMLIRLSQDGVAMNKRKVQGGPSGRIVGLTLICDVPPSAWFCLG